MLRRVLMVLVGVLALGVLGAPAAFAEEGCPNEASRQAEQAAHPEGFATQLPDCRAYEQVTPVDKDGAGPADFPDGVQAAPAGNGLVFPVLGNMPGGSGDRLQSYFLASRGGQGWSDEGLEAPTEPHGFNEVSGWSEDLAEAVLLGSEVGAGSGAGVYLRADATGSFQLVSPLSFEHTFQFGLAGFSADDSRVLIESTLQLSPGAVAGESNLYEWHAGTVSLVGVLPNGSAPAGGSFAGPNGGSQSRYYTLHTISGDGSRVFFTAGGTEQIYVRENGTGTVPVGLGVFLAATPDGSKVIYLSGGVVGHLEMFDVESERTIDLTPAGGVEGALGMSDDGSYVYFAANGGGIYVWHNGSVRFITGNSQPFDWSDQTHNGGEYSLRTSRVTPDGRFLLFAGSGVLERYDAVHGRLSCVSCSPSGSPPVGVPTLESKSSVIGGNEPGILRRNLSADGGRVFFESSEALLPQDTNGVQDVYEWEQQGVGSCQGSSATFSVASGGCLYLVSSGTSSSKSYFADASANGDDVFFFTFQPLVGQDQDGLFDIYDARVGGGLAAQNPPALAPPCEEEGCRPVAGAAPAFGEPASVTFVGAGNLAPPATAVVLAPRPKSKRTVAKSKRRKKRRARKAGRDGRGARVHKATRGGK